MTMTTTIYYGSSFTIHVYDEYDNCITYDFTNSTLGEALKEFDMIVKNMHPLIRGEHVDHMLITDMGTGEILAECATNRSDDLNDEPDDWNDEPYDLEMGFDPYLGCYSDDI